MRNRYGQIGVLLCTLATPAQADELVDQLLVGPSDAVDIAGSDEALWLVDSAGALWLREGSTGLWFRAVRGVGDGDARQDALLELEATLQDGLAEPEDLEIDDDGNVVGGFDEGLLDLVDELVDRIERRDLDDGVAVGWVEEVAPGQILAGLPSGVWSSDSGAMPTRIAGPAVAATWWNDVLVHVSPDGRVYADSEHLVLDLDVRSVASADGSLWLAGANGVYRLSEEGPVLVVDISARHVVADPGWEGGLWLVADNGQVLRTDSGGEDLRLLDGAPDIEDLDVGLPTPGGQLLVTGEDGTYSYDAQTGWTQRDGRSGVAVSGWSALYVVSDEKLYGGPSADSYAVPPEWISLGALLDSTQNRVELSQSMSQRRLAQTLMPDVTVQGDLSPDSRLDFDGFTASNRGSVWSLRATVTWTPAGRNAGSEEFANASDDVFLRTDVDVSTGRDALNSRSMVVGREAVMYRAELINQVTDLFEQRRALQMRSSAVKRQGLLEQVAWQLQLNQIEARLDALSNGAVSAWNQND